MAKYLLDTLTNSQRANLLVLIAGMRRGTLGTTAIFGNGPAAYGLVRDAHIQLTAVRLDQGKTRAEVGDILDAELTAKDQSVTVEVPVINQYVDANLTPAQQNALEGLILALKDETQGTTGISGAEATYGLTAGAGLALRASRLNAPYLTRKQIGYLLSEQLTAILTARNVAAPKAKRPSSWTFRKLTKDRITAVKSLIKDMKAGDRGTYEIVNEGRLTFGLTQKALDTMIQMRTTGKKTRAQVGTWLATQLAIAIREQEAAAHAAGKGSRRVAFR